MNHLAGLRNSSRTARITTTVEAGKQLPYGTDWNNSQAAIREKRCSDPALALLPLARLALLLGSTVILVAQTEHITPFTGTWKLDVANSSFNPGPPFKRFTITFTPDGTRHLDLLAADGQVLKASLPWSDGKEVHVTGMENATAVSQIQGRTFHDIWKQNGRIIEDVHAVVSSDGRILTTTVDAMYQAGHPIHNRLTFDKQ